MNIKPGYVLIALLLASCGSQPAAPASPAASDNPATSGSALARAAASAKPAASGSVAASGLTAFKIASPSKSINSLPDSVAREFGYFTSRGLAPVFVLAASAPALAGLQ